MASAADVTPCGGGARSSGTERHACRRLRQWSDALGKPALQLGFTPGIGEHVPVLVNRLVPVLPGAVRIVVNDVIRDRKHHVGGTLRSIDWAVRIASQNWVVVDVHVL